MAAPKVFQVSIPADTDPEAGLELARQKASGVGIRLEGDSETGTFSGTASGSYARDGHNLRFEVREKPFFVSWSMIESQLRKVFGDVDTA